MLYKRPTTMAKMFSLINQRNQSSLETCVSLIHTSV